MAPFISRLREILTVPELRGLDLDDPRLTALRKTLIYKKVFLHRIYQTWYRQLCEALPLASGAVLELGSGGGFFKERLPDVITSDIFYISDIRLILDGRQLPFSSASLKAICMVNVLHHIPDVRAFFREATRCVRPGGVVTMIEPWVTPFARFIQTQMHYEPFLPDAPNWEFSSKGPLSSANGALPWIMCY